MLQGLTIRDVVLIDRLDLTFAPGLSVLTGETGAGKSILLDALGLALGRRGDSALVRQGREQAVVSASFAPPAESAAWSILAEGGLERGEDDGLILRRQIGADGRGRAFVNDQPVSVALLRRLGDSLVEIHGQFENQGLLDPSQHRAALDAFAGNAAALAEVATRHGAWSVAEAAERDARLATEAIRGEEAFLRHALEELDAVAPVAGEEAALAGKRQVMAARERLVDAIAEASEALAAGKGLAASLHAARRALERVREAAMGRLDPAIEALDRAAIETGEAENELGRVAGALDSDASQLEALEERLFALRALARKHRVPVDALAELRETIAAKLHGLDDGEAATKRLAAATRAARGAYVDAAGALSAARAKAAKELDRRLARELPPLKLERARFVTRLDPLDESHWGREGSDRVTFEVATNPGAEPGPIGRIASGGELARFMLALKVVLVERGPRAKGGPALIFDEVDSGISGAVAAAVGERLAALATRLQVLVVTHSPQVAARGERHFLVSKNTAARQAATSVQALDAGQRREEIARLLSGARVTEAARLAADALLAGASA